MREQHHHSHAHPEAKPVTLHLGAPEAERQIVDVTPVTAVSWEFGRSLLALPENLTGVRILDIGGGASDMTAKFLEDGADAFAIDPRYKSRSDLKGRALNELKYHRHGKERDQRAQEAIEQCIESMRANPKRYVAAFATNLPFEENSFDIVYSHAAIFGYLDVDYLLLLKAVNETLRVTRPGGSVQLTPFNTDHMMMHGAQAQALRKQSHSLLLQSLKNSKEISFRIEDTTPPFGRLNITIK